MLSGLIKQGRFRLVS